MPGAVPLHDDKPAAPLHPLSPREIAMLQRFRAADDFTKRYVQRLLQAPASD